MPFKKKMSNSPRKASLVKRFNSDLLCRQFDLSTETLTTYQESFDLFDRDGDGRITGDEIGVLCKSLGYTISKESIGKMLMLCDTDGNGIVDFKEFLQLLRAGRRRYSVGTRQELNEIFKVFDKNRDGFIDEQELENVLVKFGERLSKQELTEMISAADTKGIGKVDLDDFIAILSSKN